MPEWNPIEHRLFSQISKNWQGVPLRTYDVALNYISTTRTASGLLVSAKLNSKAYQKGEQVSGEEMEGLNIRRHKSLPEWNYHHQPVQQKSGSSAQFVGNLIGVSQCSLGTCMYQEARPKVPSHCGRLAESNLGAISGLISDRAAEIPRLRQESQPAPATLPPVTARLDQAKPSGYHYVTIWLPIASCRAKRSSGRSPIRLDGRF
ncbi:MAG: ISAzo13-like element transposase-related protein [Steroidobacteraceae bacterium]